MYGVLISALVLLGFSASSAAFTLQQYLSSVANNHPEILAIDATTGQYGADIQYADGAYDAKLEHNSFSRVAGYYDGLQASQKFSKPLEAYNAEIFSEYRISDGDFPVYEQEYATLSGGEASLGVKLSLLQGRDTDKKRTAMASARLKYKMWSEEAKLAQSEFYYSAILAYLDWVEAVSYFNKIEQLVAVSVNRQEGIKTRVAEGDVAEFELLEFETRLLERQSSLLAAERKVRANMQKLRYYMHSGEAFDEQSQAPKSAAKITWPASFNLAVKSSDVDNHPALAAKALEMQALKQKMRLAQVALLPKLDIEAKVARDIGSGPTSLQDTEAKIGLYFSVPFDRTQAKAKKSRTQYEIYALESKTNALRQSIDAKRQERLVNLSYAKRLHDMQTKQVVLSRKLFEQEQRQFEFGSSDFFMLNNREADAFQAELKALTTRINVFREELALLKINAVLDHPFIQKTLRAHTLSIR
ncbi:Outer membrane protein-like protein [Paraglaciecola sp. T6c]|uniref:TolC family protein n=1 Tax=Pseudoalteromonas atlantica (strain T6c / ATCC BAA-1087) TaxID=3042615 RepID=UPI00005C535C|nr:TolC family protein [Paraglaciecola sp. T6c]ABG38816.1 Outer membrane protein-like protein [Paraglaciecola sp. T6c]